MNDVLQIDPSDNVLVALKSIDQGVLKWGDQEIPIPQMVRQKHKFLIYPLKKGQKIIMYGVPVGTAMSDLPAGTLISTFNVTHFAAPASLENKKQMNWSPPEVKKWSSKTFMGYKRPDGKVGTANYWLFVPLVFCENRNLKILQDALTRALGYHKSNDWESYIKHKTGQRSSNGIKQLAEKPFKNIDGIKFLYHQGGCGGTRKDSELLLRLLAQYVAHPNVAGATILSLGCQHAQIDWFQEIYSSIKSTWDKPIVYLEQQKLKTEEALIESAIDQTLAHFPTANESERTPSPLSALTIGLECGGSDGFSGISANPLVGEISDRIVALGGSSLLSEFPELNGVEQHLVDRCVNDEVAKKFLHLQHQYEQRAKLLGSGFDMNPSPGNIKDGLITDAIKSAGAARKGGTAPITGVLDYTESMSEKGLHLLCTPGNDVESTTGLAGSGANLILFTTGLGTPTGNPIAPVVKISTNSSLAERMTDIIDFDAGGIINGSVNMQQSADALLEQIISVASGNPTKAVSLDQDDFIPWKRDISL